MNNEKFSIKNNVLTHNEEPVFSCEIINSQLSENINIISDVWQAKDISKALHEAAVYLLAINEAGELPT